MLLKIAVLELERTLGTNVMHLSTERSLKQPFQDHIGTKKNPLKLERLLFVLKRSLLVLKSASSEPKRWKLVLKGAFGTKKNTFGTEKITLSS